MRVRARLGLRPSTLARQGEDPSEHGGGPEALTAPAWVSLLLPAATSQRCPPLRGTARVQRPCLAAALLGDEVSRPALFTAAGPPPCCGGRAAARTWSGDWQKWQRTGSPGRHGACLGWVCPVLGTDPCTGLYRTGGWWGGQERRGHGGRITLQVPRGLQPATLDSHRANQREGGEAVLGGSEGPCHLPGP